MRLKFYCSVQINTARSTVHIVMIFLFHIGKSPCYDMTTHIVHLFAIYNIILQFVKSTYSLNYHAEQYETATQAIAVTSPIMF